MTKTRDVVEETLVFDRKEQRQILRLNKPLCLPIGTEIELEDPNISIRVVGVRFLANGTLCLDVEDMPESHGDADA